MNPDNSLHDDRVWHVQQWSERKGRWVRVGRRPWNPTGIWRWQRAIDIRNQLRKRYPGRSFRVRIAVANPFTLLEGEFEIVRTSKEPATPGQHSSKSYHYRLAPWGGSQARDYGTGTNPSSRVVRAANRVRAGTPIGGRVPRYRGRFVAELFGPFDWYVKDGVVFRGEFPDHDDHMHLALTP